MTSIWPLGENHYLKCILQYENAPDPKRTQIFHCLCCEVLKALPQSACLASLNLSID